MKILQFKSESGNRPIVSIYAAIVCFAAYICIFSFRKAFNVAAFSGYTLFGLDYKILIVVTQVFGYMASKFYGIKLISELKRVGRGKLMLMLVGIAWFAWLLFALIPPPYNFWCLLLNGFPLGFIWGIIFSYVEGRRATDFIGSALAVSFIFGSGVAKSAAQYVMNNWGVGEYWMPFVIGGLFMVPLLFFVYLLEKIPEPDAEDIAHRTERVPMLAKDRNAFLKQFLPGVILLVIIYILVTILREVRDSFMADMWRESGEQYNASVFASTETWVSIIILVVMASMVLIKNNFKAFSVVQFIMLGGFLLSGISTVLFANGGISMFYWITTVGLGLYLVYIPFNSMLFDRLLATFRISGTVGFLIYVADAFGYLGSVAVMLSKNIFQIQLNWLSFYTNLVLIAALIGGISTVGSILYFFNKKSRFK